MIVDRKFHSLNGHRVQSLILGLHKKSKRSAEGAEYESQGQARSEAKRSASPLGRENNLVQR